MEHWLAAQEDLKAIAAAIEGFDFPESEEPVVLFLQEKMDAINAQVSTLLNHMQDPDAHPIEYT